MSAPTTPISPGSPLTSLYQVIIDYIPEHDGEIGLVFGDVISTIKDLGNGWTLGKNVSNGNVVGIFPSTCVRLLSTFPANTTSSTSPPPPPPPRSLYDPADSHEFADKQHEFEDYSRAGTCTMFTRTGCGKGSKRQSSCLTAERRAKSSRSRYDKRDEIACIDGYLSATNGGDSILHSMWSPPSDDDFPPPPPPSHANKSGRTPSDVDTQQYHSEPYQQGSGAYEGGAYEGGAA